MAGSKSATRAARQLYLFGGPDGKRVLDVNRLAEQVGVHFTTIQRHIKDWEREHEELLGNTSKTAQVLTLSKETLDQHKKDMIFLRDQINQIKFELDSIEEITIRLQNFIDKFDNDDDRDEAISIFDAWHRACAQKSALRSQFLALQKQWTHLSGMVDLKDVEVVRAKEIAKAQAKLEIKQDEAGRMQNAEPASKPGGIFQRRIG